jgi:hypothetical protein
LYTKKSYATFRAIFSQNLKISALLFYTGRPIELKLCCGYFNGIGVYDLFLENVVPTESESLAKMITIGKKPGF